MSKKIVIVASNFEVEATLLEDKRPKTCAEIWNELPIEGKAMFYREEIYFKIPVEIEPENPTSSTEPGDVSYWPDGRGFCIFFGTSQPVSPVNTFARIGRGIEKFCDLEEESSVTVRKST